MLKKFILSGRNLRITILSECPEDPSRQNTQITLQPT